MAESLYHVGHQEWERRREMPWDQQMVEDLAKLQGERIPEPWVSAAKYHVSAIDHLPLVEFAPLFFAPLNIDEDNRIVTEAALTCKAVFKGGDVTRTLDLKVEMRGRSVSVIKK